MSPNCCYHLARVPCIGAMLVQGDTLTLGDIEMNDLNFTLLIIMIVAMVSCSNIQDINKSLQTIAEQSVIQE